MQGLRKTLTNAGQRRFPEVKFLGPLDVQPLVARMHGDGPHWRKRLPFGLIVPLEDTRSLPAPLTTDRKAFSVEWPGDLIVMGDVWCSLYLCAYLVLSIQFRSERRPNLPSSLVLRAQVSTHPEVDDPDTTFSAKFATDGPAAFVDTLLSGISHSVAGRNCLTPATPWYTTSACRTLGPVETEPASWGLEVSKHPSFTREGALRVFERACHYQEADYLLRRETLPVTHQKTMQRVELVGRLQDLVRLQSAVLEYIRSFCRAGANRLRKLRADAVTKFLFSNERAAAKTNYRLLAMMEASDAHLSRDSLSSLPWQRSVYSRLAKAHRVPKARGEAFSASRSFQRNLWATRAARGQWFSVIVEVVSKLGGAIPG